MKHKHLIFFSLLAAGVLAPTMALATPNSFAPPAATATSKNTASIAWGRADMGIVAQGDAVLAAHARGYSFSFSHQYRGWGVKIKAGTGWSFANFGLKSEVFKAAWRVQNFGISGTWQAWKNRNVSLVLGAAGGITQTQMARAAQCSNCGGRATTVAIRPSANLEWATEFGRLNFRISQQPWRVFLVPEGEEDEVNAPVIYSANWQGGQWKIGYKFLEASGDLGIVANYSTVAVGCKLSFGSIQVGKSWGGTNVWPQLSAAQVSLSPRRPWMFYQGGVWVKVEANVEPGLRVDFMYFRGNPPQQEGNEITAGGSQISAGLTLSF